jgi:4-amino-4-deoxy-L-arabinose transferase-like glycosyltransferase
VSRRAFVGAVVVVLALAALPRLAWLTADPPTQAHANVGVVWHDEGAWVHNARNRALWGAWRTDNWNPMFLTPVFTALEYAAFRAFGVGLWQARTVPVVSGLAAIAFFMAGLSAIAGRRAAVMGGALLSCNYVFLMWNRAALMESTMTSLMVMSWAACGLARAKTWWALPAGVFAVLAFFTKASAAAFLAAVVFDSLVSVWLDRARDGRRAIWTVVGVAGSLAVIAAAFVLPYWSEFRFYNWEMSVVRKPDYSIGAFITRASWLPVVHDFFMWMWPVLVVAVLSMSRIASRWRSALPAERLLVLWVVVGLLELVIHDSGNERRYVMFMPAFIALAALGVGPAAGAEEPAAAPARGTLWFLWPFAVGMSYLVAASGLRVAFLDRIHGGGPHPYHAVVVVSAVAAAAMGLLMLAAWTRSARWLARPRPPLAVIVVAAVATMAGDIWHFARWARTRQEVNYRASIEVGRLLPAGTPVQGKLANGLSLDNLIRPIFIGRGFGNYADRLQREDVGYILTYVSPSEGYESQPGLIGEILDHYPRRRVIATFAVDETGGVDRAALIEKVPGSDPRARD